MFNLLQKFIECDVIEDCKLKGRIGKDRPQFEDSQHKVYRFILCPAPLNFISEDEDEPVSTENTSMMAASDFVDDVNSTCIANSFALKGGTVS